MPLAMVDGTTIQSPTWSMSFCDSWMPATNPRMESLKISISAAANAPRPVSNAAGDLLTRIDTAMMVAIIHTMPCAVFRMPFSGRLRAFSFLSNPIHINDSTELMALTMV